MLRGDKPDGSRKNPYVLKNMDYAFLNIPKENLSVYSVSNNPDVGDYTVAMGGQGMGVHDPEVIDRVKFAEFSIRNITDKNKYKESIWKLHFTVHPDDVEKAWDLVYPELMKNNFPHFKVTRMNVSAVSRALAEKEKQKMEADNPTFNDAKVYADYLKLNSDIDTIDRVTDGMQITIYIPKDQEQIYNEFALKLEEILLKGKVRPGIINPSDRVLGLYSSLRQENSHLDPEHKYVAYDEAKHYMFDAQHDPFKASKKTWKTEKLTYKDLDFAKLTKHVKVIREKLFAAEEKYIGNATKNIKGDDNLKAFVLLYKSYRRHLRQIFDTLMVAEGQVADISGFKTLVQELEVYKDLVEMGKRHKIKSVLNKDSSYQAQLIGLQKIANAKKPHLVRQQTVTNIAAANIAAGKGGTVAKQVASAAMAAADEEQPARPPLVRKPRAKISVEPSVIKKANEILAAQEKAKRVSLLLGRDAERDPEPHLSESSASRRAVDSAAHPTHVVEPIIIDSGEPHVSKDPTKPRGVPTGSAREIDLLPSLTPSRSTDESEHSSPSSDMILEGHEAEPLLRDSTSGHMPLGFEDPGDDAMSKMLSGRSSVRLPKANPSYEDKYHKPTKPNTLAYVLGGIAVALVLTVLIVATSGVAAGAIAGLGAVVLTAAGATATVTVAASLGAAIVGVGMAIVGALAGLFAKKNADKSYRYYKGLKQASDEVKRVPVPDAPTLDVDPVVIDEIRRESTGPILSTVSAPAEDLSEGEDEEDSLIVRRTRKATKAVEIARSGSVPKSAPIPVGSHTSGRGSPSVATSGFGLYDSTPKSPSRFLSASHDSSSSLSRSQT